MATIAQRVQKHRKNLRKSGLRPIQIWVPDKRSPGFAKEFRKQSTLIKGSAAERDIMEFIEKVADTTGWVWDGDTSGWTP